MEFLAFGEIRSCNMPGMRESCCILWRKITVLMTMSPLGACFGYCFCYYALCVLKIPQILQHTSPSDQQEMYLQFLSQNFSILEHTPKVIPLKTKFLPLAVALVCISPHMSIHAVFLVPRISFFFFCSFYFVSCDLSELLKIGVSPLLCPKVPTRCHGGTAHPGAAAQAGGLSNPHPVFTVYKYKLCQRQEWNPPGQASGTCGGSGSWGLSADL